MGKREIKKIRFGLGFIILLLAFYGAYSLCSSLLAGPAQTLKRAQDLLRKGDLDQSLKITASILRISPQDAAARNFMGEIYSQLHSWEEAEKQYEIAEQAAKEALEDSRKGQKEMQRALNQSKGVNSK